MASTYTFNQKGPKKNAGGYSFFNGQATDGNNVVLQGEAAGIQTSDATPTTPVTSPVTLAASGTKTLVSPESSARLTLLNTGTNPITFSEVSSGSSATLNAGDQAVLPVVRQSDVYLASTSGSTVSFYYEVY